MNGLTSHNINRLIRLSQKLKDEGNVEDAIEVARVVVLQDIYMKHVEPDEVVDADDALLGVCETSFGNDFDLAKLYIIEHDMDVQDALAKIADMCSDCMNAEEIKWLDKDGKITTEDARDILREKGEFSDTQCEYCKDKDIKIGEYKKLPEEK